MSLLRDRIGDPRYLTDVLVGLINRVADLERRNNVGGLQVPLTSVSGGYAMNTNDGGVLASGTITVTLPSAIGKGRVVKIVNTGTGTVTVAAQPGQSIEGAASLALAGQWASCELMADGAALWVRTDA
jgi:hypothetical protein